MNQEQAGETQKLKTGRKRLVWLIACLLVAAIGGLIWLAMPPKEPVYHGQPLSYWLSRSEEYGMGDPKDPKGLDCREAIRAIGTNAIPSLLRILKAKDPAIKIVAMGLLERQDFIHLPISTVEEQKGKAQIGFYLLGDLASNSVPALIDISTHPATPYSKQIADFVLMQLYPLPGAATPSWVLPDKRAQWYLDAGMVKAESGAASNAILAFSQAIKLDPTNADAYLSRRANKMQLQDFAGAKIDIDKVMQLSPSNESAFYSRGLCKFSLKDFKGADADFTTAINLETNDIRAYNSRGLARANKRELNDALADFNKAIELSPREAESYRNRAAVEGLQKEYEMALADVSKSIELDKRDAVAYATRGRIKNALKDYNAALMDFDKAIELNPKDSVAYASRGTASMYLDDFTNSAADVEMALQLNPKNVVAFLVRGMIKAKRGGEDDAMLADFRHAVELAPQMSEPCGLLGLFQYKTSDWVSALANCRKALALGTLADKSDYNSYIWLIRAQSGEAQAANTELYAYLKSLPDAKTNEWSAITARFFTGSLSESNFLSLATTAARRPSAVKGQVCESLYYSGMKRKLAGDKKGAAELFQKCLDTRNDNSLAYMNAMVEMRALKQP
jgi:tetratricopeptide (TPR) repeat protein